MAEASAIAIVSNDLGYRHSHLCTWWLKTTKVDEVFKMLTAQRKEPRFKHLILQEYTELRDRKSKN